MVSATPAVPLAQLEVLVVDCQATTAAPRGHLLEIGWARTGIADTRACLVALPPGEQVPPAVARITGITDRMLTRAGVDARAAWRALAATAATLDAQPAPTIIHFARFEEPFLRDLSGGAPALDIVCTHAIARRLLPDLPRRTLRALAGYFGRAVDPLRRSADHVDATMFVWRELVAMLEAQGVASWSALKAWLAAPAERTGPQPRVWPMPRDVRLALPDAPGIYRLRRSSGDVLYVGKAASLHDRVNSYFRHQRGIPERLLEMLSQARAISFEVCASALEAALVEADEIKRLRPPYNIALTEGERDVWFATPDLMEWGTRPSGRCSAGPFPSAELLEQFAAFARERRTALGRGRWAPDETIFAEGCRQLRETHSELSRHDLPAPARLLRLGARLWREGRRDRDEDDDAQGAHDHQAATWTPESVRLSLEWLAIRAALARRRAAWFTRLAEASVAWREPDGVETRLLVIENGEVGARAPGDPDAEPPVPPGHDRPRDARRDAFTLARFDRLRVLTTELKRLVAAGAPVAVRLGSERPLAGDRLAALLWWL